VTPAKSPNKLVESTGAHLTISISKRLRNAALGRAGSLAAVVAMPRRTEGVNLGEFQTFAGAVAKLA
jgi:hypothetical protein